MIDALRGDAEIWKALHRLRPDEHSIDALARIAWNVITEPGDGVAGALIAELGAADALEFALGNTSVRRSEASGICVDDDFLRVPGSGIPPSAARESKALQEARARWSPRADIAAVRDALHGAAGIGARLLLPADPEWPTAVDDLGAHAPVALWVRGDAGMLNSRRPAAIVGARAATAYGEHVAAELAGDLAASGTLIVSGGAYGIDGAAHRAALGTGGPTAALLAGGVDRAYPAGHQDLFRRISTAGVVVSELPCGAAPTKWRFLARNRLIAALGAATVVVEAGWRSGSLNTAGHAASLGRPLGAVPGPITSAASAGCHRLLREYDARCVTSTAEFRELLGDGEAEAYEEHGDDPEQTRLLDALSSRTAREPGELARRSGLSVEQVIARLGLMSLEGRAVRSDMGWRQRSG